MAIDKGQPVNMFPSAVVGIGVVGIGAWINFIKNQGGTTFLRVTNGANGPDDRPAVIMEVAESAAGLKAREIFRASAPITDNAVTDFTHHHALADRYIRVTFDNSLGDQAITAEAHHHPVVNIG